MAWFSRNPNPVLIDIAHVRQENARLAEQVETLEKQIKTILESQITESEIENIVSDYINESDTIANAVTDYLDNADITIRIR